MVLFWFLFCFPILVLQCNCIEYEDIFQNVDLDIFQKLAPSCQKDVEKIAKSTEFWLMANSSGELTELKENYAALMGDYDQCLKVSEINAKFCKVFVTAHRKQLPFDLFKSYGQGTYLCVPRSCTSDDLNLLADGLLKFPEEQCLDGLELKYDVSAIVAITVFGLIGVIVTLSTLYDVWLVRTKKESQHSIFLAFSIYTNTKNFFSVCKSTGEPHLNGLRFLTTLVVVMFHDFALDLWGPLDNIFDFYVGMKHFSRYIFDISALVDTFFVIRGFVTAHSFNSNRNKRIKFNLTEYYLHRYFRITPALAAMVLLYSAVNYLGSGPFWKSADVVLAKPCKDYWWAVLFYVQGCFSISTPCIVQAWFLSTDMQLFLLSPIFLYLMYKWPKWGYICISLLSVVSITLGFVIAYVYNLSGNMTKTLILSEKTEDFLAYFYYPVYTRASPYFLGFMLYYFIDKLKKSKSVLKMSMSYVYLGWILCFFAFLIFVCFDYIVENSKYGNVVDALALALLHPTWGLFICWIIFVCATGSGGVLNNFLSKPIFQILTRLSYSMYITHAFIIYVSNFSRETPFHFNIYNVILKIAITLLASIFGGFVWYLIFEAPFLVIDKVLFKKQKPKTTN